MKNFVHLFLLMIICPKFTNAQSWYEPDLTFGGLSNGRYLYPAKSEFRAIARRSDGSYLVAGSFDSLATEYTLIKRIMPDGTVDASFGLAISSSKGKIFDLVIGADNNFYVCGYTLNGYDEQVGFIRGYDADGNLDAQYLVYGEPSMVYKIKQLSDGTILAAGRETNSFEDRARIWKLKEDLSGLVTGFGSSLPIATSKDGVVKIEHCIPTTWVSGFSSFYGIDVQSDGKILACGSFRAKATDQPTAFISRWNANGTADISGLFYSSYNIATWPIITGKTPSALYKDVSELYDVAAHTTGMYIGGYYNYYYSNTSSIGLSLDFGSLDTSLSGQSFVINDEGATAPERDVITCMQAISGLGCVFLGNHGYPSQQIWMSKLSALLIRDSSFQEEVGMPKRHNYFLPLGAGSTSEFGYDFLFDTDSSILIAGGSTRSANNYGTITKLKFNRPTSGVKEHDLLTQAQLYPNPTRDYIQLNRKALTSTSSVIAVYNSIGQLVLLIPEFQERITVSHLNSGQYFVMADAKLIGTFIKQ